MKALRRLLPRSLRGRFVALMIAGVVLAQLAGHAVWHSQARATHLELVDRVSRDLALGIASTARFFGSLPYEYRHIVLDQLRQMGGTRFFVSLNRERIRVADIPDSEEKRIVVANVREVLQQALALSQVQIEFSPPESLHVLNNEILLKDLPPRWAEHTLLLEPLSPPVLVVQLALAPDAWLYVATLVPVPGFLSDQGLLTPERLVALLLTLAVVVGLSLLGVRGLTRPLAQIAGAAQALGRDLDHPPLPEDGSTELAATARAFNRMQERLQGYLRDRERLFSAISHDLKTPITRLRLRAELLDDAALRAKFVRDLAELDLMVKGALQSVKDTDIHENPEPVDVAALLAAMREDLLLRGAVLEVRGSAAPIRARPLALKRCLTNLVDNAVFYGERAEVRLEDGAEALAVRIRDRGPGIPEDKLEAVFEPFVRLEPSRNRNTGGTGLGLGIARHIARAHGGELSLHNHPGGGLEARLVLPRQAES